MNVHLRNHIVCGTALFALIASSGAFAQAVPASDEAVMLEEITVTARRQAESLVRVPATITSISSSELVLNHATSLISVAELVPQVTIARGTSGNNGIFSIRGIGSASSDSGIEQSVGINIDDVSISRGRLATAAQFDMSQVEVLKGPQALFFGKNSPAGVISITSADPTRQLSGFFRTGYEFVTDERYAEAAISGGLAETLSARLAGRYSKSKGWIHNDAVARDNPFSPALPFPGPTTGRSPGSESASARLTLLWEPTSDLSVRFKYLINRETGNGGDGQQEVFCRNGNANPMTVNPFTGARFVDLQQNCSIDRHRAVSLLPTAIAATFPAASKDGAYDRATNQFASLRLGYTGGDIDVTTVTGYTHLKARNSTVGTMSSYATVVAFPAERYESLSQEIRLISKFEGPLNFNTGVYADHSKRTNLNTAMIGIAAPDPITGRYHTLDGFFDGRGNSLSAYGQARWTPIDNVELAGGVRYTREKRKVRAGNTYTHSLIGPAFRLSPAGAVIRSSARSSNWSPEITATYHPTERSTIYLAYKTGYKSGGLSNPGTLTANYVTNPDELRFAPEKAKGFEGGYKGEILDRTVRVELTAYRYNFSDLQLSSFNPTLIAFTIRNAANARTTGVEGSLDWKATRELTLRSNISYNKAKFTSFPNATCYAGQTATQGCVATRQDRSGQPLTRAPKWALNGGFRYETELTSALGIALTGDAIYSDKYFLSDAGDPQNFQGSFWKFNASVAVRSADDRWELALIGRNLTNKNTLLYSVDKTFGLPGEYVGGLSRPREVLAQLSYSF